MSTPTEEAERFEQLRFEYAQLRKKILQNDTLTMQILPGLALLAKLAARPVRPELVAGPQERGSTASPRAV